jgi:hypothetical protein
MHLHFVSMINVNYNKQNAESNRKSENAHSFQIRRKVVDPEGTPVLYHR